jgi:hypothetical protein
MEGHGLNLQSGYFIAQDWELAGRASWVRPGAELAAIASDLTQYTVGATRYLRGHRFKVQSDLTWNEPSASTRNWIACFQVEMGI